MSWSSCGNVCGLAALLSHATAVHVKGSFHQHAAQPWKKCHRATSDIDACGPGCEHEQDDGGTAADNLLKAMVASAQGYDFVGLVGNEDLPVPPKHAHGLVLLNVTENQMAAVCAKGSHKCPAPCNPVVPRGSGPWKPANDSGLGPAVNNLHRAYIEGVPGVFVQHPNTDPERDDIYGWMVSGEDDVRGLEVQPV